MKRLLLSLRLLSASCAFLVLAVFLCPAIVSADTFEGKVSLAISAPDLKTPLQMTYSIKGHLIRMDTTGGPKAGGMGGIIFDQDKQQMTILMPQNSMYMVRAMPKASDLPPDVQAKAQARAEDAQNSIVDTGEKTTILGYSCSKYTTTSSKGSVTEMWITDQLGNFAGFSAGGAPGGPGGSRRGGQQSPIPPGLESLLKGKGFFPLRIVSSSGGKEKFRMEATAIDKSSIDDSVFVPPDGWRKLDLGALGLPGGLGFPGMH